MSPADLEGTEESELREKEGQEEEEKEERLNLR